MLHYLHMGFFSGKSAPSLPKRLSRDSFSKLMAGKGSYVPSDVKDTLKDAGMGSLLMKGHVTEREAMRALKALRKAGKTPRGTMTDTRMYKTVAKEQFEAEQAAIQEEKLRHTHAAIRADVAEEAEELAKRVDSILDEDTDRIGRLQRSEHKRITRESLERKKSVERDAQKRKSFYQPKGVNAKKPKLADDLPDMGIDFGD